MAVERDKPISVATPKKTTILLRWPTGLNKHQQKSNSETSESYTWYLIMEAHVAQIAKSCYHHIQSSVTGVFVTSRIDYANTLL